MGAKIGLYGQSGQYFYIRNVLNPGNTSVSILADSTIMFRIVLILTAVFTGFSTQAQTEPLTKAEKEALDSMFMNDAFVQLMMDARKNKSYFDIGIGMGNGMFSVKNNALNAGQAITSKLFYTPTLAYYHKSGFSFSASAFAANDDGKLTFYQYAVSPAYVINNKKINAGISYTRFIEGSAASFDVSPFKNDFYGNFLYKKTWIQPGIGLGFSFGREREYFDTAFWLLNQVVHIRDTITTRLSSISVIATASHQWDFYRLLSKKDALRLQPVLMLNTGSQRWNISHSSSFFQRRPLVQNYLKRRFGDGSDSDSYKLQSIGFLAQASYYYGKFYLQPQLYLDYYLPSTSEKRLTSLFSVLAGFSF